jgi:O-acetyl-ADP-ribose deacetylase
MMKEIKINNTNVKAIRDDLTNLAVDAFVFYSNRDLKLGSGYGNAISTRGGPTIKSELDKIGKADITDAVITKAGKLPSKYIIHAVGPSFQEENTENKLKKTIENTLKLSSEKGIKTLAFPIMGIGFYGVQPDTSIRIMLESIKQYLKTNDTFEEIIICANDNREYRLLAGKFENFN